MLGALSDAYGRRPVIMLSLVGSAVGYVVFGIGGSLWVLFLDRIIDGLYSGGLSALFGYLTDITPEEQRGKVFGQIGATVGAGFIVGPAIGGLIRIPSVSRRNRDSADSRTPRPEPVFLLLTPFGFPGVFNTF